ncbi:hypothetical protein N7520_004266 [Penicillium odoratum]|uniref:uncharacterized protein n=1 Tax=Penicillium odoratum TaxID=1167516 RepID=UPI002547F0B7|nr:uncharacterized protein N7520_004266 [Penicillium odoratum]KAJ5769707.1 hypothetical protein N7520_004266 [Penicillium odoratum]
MLTFYFLQTSRAFRIAWLLEELNVEYDLKSAERNPDLSVPTSLKVPTSLGKSPAIRDGNLVVGESGAITEYLVETYDTERRLMPLDLGKRVKVREYMWAAEGTFLMHGLAIWALRPACPESVKEDGLDEIEAKLAVPVQRDFDWLENELANSGGPFLLGNDVTAADTMLAFSCQFIIASNLGLGKKSWPHINKWLENVEKRDAYQRAIKRTGHHL